MTQNRQKRISITDMIVTELVFHIEKQLLLSLNESQFLDNLNNLLKKAAESFTTLLEYDVKCMNDAVAKIQTVKLDQIAQKKLNEILNKAKTILEIKYGTYKVRHDSQDVKYYIKITTNLIAFELLLSIKDKLMARLNTDSRLDVNSIIESEIRKARYLFETRSAYPGFINGVPQSKSETVCLTDFDKSQQEIIIAKTREMLSKINLRVPSREAAKKEAAKSENPLQQRMNEVNQMVNNLHEYCDEYMQQLIESIKACIKEADRKNPQKPTLYSLVFIGVYKPDLERDIQHILNIPRLHPSRKAELAKIDGLSVLLNKFYFLDEAKKLLPKDMHVTADDKIHRIDRFESYVRDNISLLQREEEPHGLRFVKKVIARFFSFGMWYKKIWEHNGDRFVGNVNTLFHNRKPLLTRLRNSITLPDETRWDHTIYTSGIP